MWASDSLYTDKIDYKTHLGNTPVTAKPHRCSKTYTEELTIHMVEMKVEFPLLIFLFICRKDINCVFVSIFSPQLHKNHPCRCL